MIRSIAVLLLALLAAPLAAAQEEGPAKRVDPLTIQGQARQKMTRLTETLARLAGELEKRKAEKSSLLKAALRFCGEKGLERRMVAAQKLIRESRYQEALDLMVKIEEDISTLLDLLLDRNRELLELLKKIQQLEDLNRQAQALIKEQEKERDRARLTADLEQHARALEEAGRQLAALEKEQGELHRRSGAGPVKPEEQRELQRRAGSIKDKLDKLAEERKRLDKEGGNPAGSDPGTAARATGEAAGSMGAAAGNLQQGKKDPARADMTKALDKLAQARQALDREREEIRDRIHRMNLEQQSRDQNRTADKTDELGRKLEQGDQDGRPLPGAEGMKGAVPHQRDAGGQLGKGKPGKAVPEQDQALEEMKKGQEELRQALEQARRRLQEELLRALEERIANILTQQKRISAATRVIHRQAAGATPPPRPVRLKAVKLGRQEGDLAGEAALALRLLREEGSTVVIPEIMDLVRSNLTTLAEDLAKARTGPATQQLQDEVERLLEAVLEAIRREQEDRDKDDKNNDGDSSDQDSPLVPRSAELRMIRALQDLVYRNTLKAKLVAEKQPDEGRRMAERLAKRQQRVHDLTRKMATSIDKDLAEEGSGR